MVSIASRGASAWCDEERVRGGRSEKVDADTAGEGGHRLMPPSRRKATQPALARSA
jgi:hypothetical protein